MSVVSRGTGEYRVNDRIITTNRIKAPGHIIVFRGEPGRVIEVEPETGYLTLRLDNFNVDVCVPHRHADCWHQRVVGVHHHYPGITGPARFSERDS